MAAGGDDNTLIKVAVFGVAFSMLVTIMLTFFAAGTSDYDYDVIKGYQSDLAEFAGDSMLNDTPWILTHVYTPFEPDNTRPEDYGDHVDEAGWLYGDDITNYPGIGTSAGTDKRGIRLDKGNVSNQMLSIGEQTDWSYVSGKAWYAGGNPYGIKLNTSSTGWGFFEGLKTGFGIGYGGSGDIYTSGSANNWNYSGYRYVFDPTLPFSSEGSSKDGMLSIVWYKTDTDTGISGGLDIYDSHLHKYGTAADDVKLGSISASKIIQDYTSGAGYTSTYNFDFEGTTLHLSLRFDPDVLSKYPSLRAAWDDGAWSIAISTVSAGNFFDVQNSTAFVDTAGSMIDTFIQIYTFEYPKFENDPFLNIVMWLMVGLPMTMAMLLVTMRLVGGVFKIF